MSSQINHSAALTWDALDRELDKLLADRFGSDYRNRFGGLLDGLNNQALALDATSQSAADASIKPVRRARAGKI